MTAPALLPSWAAYEADLVASIAALEGILASVHRTSKAANRDSKAKPGQVRPFVGVPPWAAAILDMSPNGTGGG